MDILKIIDMYNKYNTHSEPINQKLPIDLLSLNGIMLSILNKFILAQKVIIVFTGNSIR